jgi:hypothetical protein
LAERQQADQRTAIVVAVAPNMAVLIDPGRRKRQLRRQSLAQPTTDKPKAPERGTENQRTFAATVSLGLTLKYSTSPAVSGTAAVGVGPMSNKLSTSQASRTK